jgi:tellurite resistance protein TehA-like permease
VRGSIFSIVLAGVLIYLYLYITIGDYAKQLIKNPPKQKADAAIILAIALI